MGIAIQNADRGDIGELIYVAIATANAAVIRARAGRQILRRHDNLPRGANR